MTIETQNIETNITEAQKNDKRKSDLLRQVGKLGEEASLGRDSLPKLAHAVVKAAADGVVTGDEAGDIYARYVKGETNKALHERSAAGKKANISKLRQLIEMGCMTTIDGAAVMQDAYQAREDMIADDNKVKSAYAYYVDVARAQLKSDRALTKAELEGMALKDEPNAKTLEGELKRVMKILEGLVTGENRDKIKDDAENTEAAYHLIRDRLDAIAMMRQRDALRKKAAELGLSLVE